MTRQEKINYIVEERMVYTPEVKRSTILDFNEADVRSSLDLLDENDLDRIISMREKAESLGATSYERGVNYGEGWEG